MRFVGRNATPADVLRQLKDFRESFVHAEGECVAGLGAIEGDASHAIVDFIEKLLAHSVVPF